MSLKYIDSNGVSHVVSGMTPGGNLETGAVAMRSGEIGNTTVSAGGYTEKTVTLSEPLPDDNYIVVLELMSQSTIAGNAYASYYNKTATSFKVVLYNLGNTDCVMNIAYKAFKLYEVADAEALYSDVTDIKAMIPSNASSSNKLSTANDLRTETRSLDRRIDDLEDVIPVDASLSNQLVTESDLSSVEIDKVEDINDVELTSIQDGQTLIWDATNSKWVNGQGGKVYSAGDGIEISNTDEISAKVDDTSITTDSNDALKVADTYKTTFVGTTAAWEALSAADKAKYNLVSLTDDAYGSASVTDAVTDGDMRPVTSNAVYDGLATKQNTLTQGTNITISGSTISAQDTTTGTSYNAGSCPDNITFATNGSVARVYAALNEKLANSDNFIVAPTSSIQCTAGTTYSICSKTLPAGKWILIGYGLLLGNLSLYISGATYANACTARNYNSNQNGEVSLQTFGMARSTGTATVTLKLDCRANCTAHADGNYCGILGIRIA